MHHCENFCSAIASALAKQEAVLSQLHEDLNMKTDNLQVSNTYFSFKLFYDIDYFCTQPLSGSQEYCYSPLDEMSC